MFGRAFVVALSVISVTIIPISQRSVGARDQDRATTFFNVVAAGPNATTLPPHGAAFVTTLPLGADVWVDGAYVGRTPAFVDLLAAGKHSIVVTRTGWAAQSATVQVDVGQVVPLSLVLQRTTTARSASGDFGELNVRGTAGATVYLDGVKIGVIPASAAKVSAGYHIVTLVSSPSVRTTRAVNVFPDTTTTVSITAGQPTGPAGDILEPVSSYIPPENVSVQGMQVTIDYRGSALRCTIGSRAYTLNGKGGLLPMAPALLGGKLFLPQSLLQQLRGKM